MDKVALLLEKLNCIFIICIILLNKLIIIIKHNIYDFYSRLLNKSIIRIEHADVPLDDEEDADRNIDEASIIFIVGVEIAALHFYWNLPYKINQFQNFIPLGNMTKI